jgi:hypothetical protein
MKQEIDIGGYLVFFPVWIITGDPKYLTLAGAKSSSGFISVDVFTDEAGANTFKDRNESNANCELVSFDVLGFLGLLEVLELRGFTHVIFDAYRGQGIVPFAIALKELRGKLLAFYGPY